MRSLLKDNAQKIGTAFLAAALLAFFSQLYHRIAALLYTAPVEKAPGIDGRDLPVAEKPARTATTAGEKAVKTAFIDCNGIYN